jgi:BlaI family transcriptional regulator, penicillinase repressor
VQLDQTLTPERLTVIKNNIKSLNTLDYRTPTPLEQVVLEYVWKHPDCTAEMCREGLAPQRKLKDSTIRTILRKLEEKGYITHKIEGRTFLYRAVETKRNIGVRAVKQLVDRFCNGSVEELLVGLVDNRILEPKQLRRLADEIASRKEKQR